MIGTWNNEEKKSIPGFYNAFTFKAKDTIKNAKGGILLMPVKANWGEVGKFISIKKTKDIYENFGNDKSSAVICGELACLGNPKEILMYRLADENASCSKIELNDSASTPKVVIELSSLYPTNREFSVTIRENVSDSTKKDLIIFEGTKPILSLYTLPTGVDNIVDTINNYSRNKYIKAVKKAESESPLADIVNQRFTGGNSGIEGLTNEAYISALAEFEKVNFNKLVLDGIADDELNATINTWIDNERKKGKPVSAFLASKDSVTNDEVNNKSMNMNNEGIIHINVKGTRNGVTYTRAESACHIAGLSCSIGVKESLCSMVTCFDDVEYLSEEEQIEANNSGTLVCYKDTDGDVLILDDVNTLDIASLDENIDKGEYLRYIRTVDFIDTVNTDIKIVGKKYKGKIDNSPGNGQIVVLTAYKKYFEEFAGNNIIKSDFEVVIDEELQAYAEKDEFFWKWNAEHISVMKRIYSTGYIK